MREFYNTSRTGAVRVWRIYVDGNKIYTQFGQLGGKLQEVVDQGQAKNVGKANEITAEEDAVLEADRMILKKVRAGYVEEMPVASSIEDLVQEDSLPENLSFYKPYNSVTPKMKKLIEERKAWLLRKYDGEMMVIRKGVDGRCQIYSRRMLPHHHLEDIPWTHRFPHLVDEIETNEFIPNGTVLLGEVIGSKSVDDRWHVASVLKSKTQKALDLQERDGWLHYVIWDVAWADRLFLFEDTEIRHRLDLAELFSRKFVRSPEILCEFEYPGDLSEIMDIALHRGWEGFVAIDPLATYREHAVNLRGKPDRPKNHCVKIKPVYEDDFIAMWDPDNGVGKYGRGKNLGKLGAVELYQFNLAGELIKISDMGNGWTNEFIDDNSDPGQWPKVLQVKYENRTYVSRGDKTNALQFPRFVAEREDKSPDECINPEL